MVTPNSTLISLSSDSTKRVEHKVDTAGTLTASAGAKIMVIPKDTLIGTGPWKTKWDSVVELRQEGSYFVAIHWAVDEYGIGETSEEALEDLLTSLVDYRASLEEREERLADKERSDLAQLRVLLER